MLRRRKSETIFVPLSKCEIDDAPKVDAECPTEFTRSERPDTVIHPVSGASLLNPVTKVHNMENTINFKTFKRICKSSPTLLKSAKPSLPTILSGTDLLASDVDRDLEAFDSKRTCSKDSTTDASSSSSISDEDSTFGDSDSSRASPPDGCKERRNDISIDNAKLPAVTTIRKVHFSLTTSKKYHMRFSTAACMTTVMCVISPFAFRIAFARLTDRMPLLPLLPTFRIIAKQCGSRLKMPMASLIITCFLSMLSRVPISMTVTRCVQRQPLADTKVNQTSLAF